MNVFFILLSLSATPFPMIAMFVVMAAIMLGYSNSRKRKLTDALKWGIEVGDEVIATTGIRGRVEKVEEDVVSVGISGGGTEECKLADCVPMEVLIQHSALLKLYAYSEEDYRLTMAGKQYSFPPQSSAAKVLKWIRNTRLALKGISLMAACALIDIALNLEDILSFFESGGRSYFQYDVAQDFLAPILVTLGVLIGGIMHLAGLYGMEDLSGSEDAKAMTKVHKGFYFFFAAEIVDFFPLAGWISIVLYIIGFVMLLVGYSRLKNSGWQGEMARGGYSQAFTASVLLLIGYIIPGVGSVISLIGYVIYYLAWKNHICKASFVEVK